jgi:hypothetical protein
MPQAPPGFTTRKSFMIMRGLRFRPWPTAAITPVSPVRFAREPVAFPALSPEFCDQIAR